MTKRCRRGGDKGKSIYLRLDDLRLKFVPRSYEKSVIYWK